MKTGPVIFTLCIALCVAFMPSLTLAQVVINELMYNPEGSDTGREWIELYNEGQSDITLVGGSGKGSWRVSDGSNHTLTDPAGGTGRGSLVVPAGGYLVVASDPNDFISGEYADLSAQASSSYSVVKSSISLSNNGTTVALIDGTGATVDSVSYTPSQGGSDDGSSLQRQSDGSWIAALPTPGAANSSTPYVPPPSVDDSSASSADQSNAPASATTQSPVQTSSYVPPPAPSLYADAGGDRTVIVGADAEFDASAYDKTQTLLDPTKVRFMWNFGDGSTAEGAAVLHHFSYPGRYAVSLEIADNRNAATDQVMVTAQPAALSFSLLPGDGVEIGNLAGEDLDLSGWIIRQDATSFGAQLMLPEHTAIFSGSALQISPQTLSFKASSSSMLEYPNGVLALAIGQSSVSTSSAGSAQQIAAPVAGPAPIAVATSKSDALSSVSASETSLPDNADDDQIATSDGGDLLASDPDDAAPSPTSTIIQTASAASSPFSKYLWWVGVAALALAAGAALVAASHFKKHEWDIVEDIEDESE